MGTPPPRPSPGPGAGPGMPPKAPTSPPNGLGSPSPTPTPPGPPKDVTEQSQPPGADLAPRAPEMGEKVPTDVSIDAATGHVTIKKPGVNLTIAKYSKENPPDKISHLEEHAKHIWIEAYNNAIDQYDGDEERAHKTAWSAVSKAGYKTKKSDYSEPQCPNCGSTNLASVHDPTIKGLNGMPPPRMVQCKDCGMSTLESGIQSAKEATHQDWIDFKHNDNEPQYGDWEEETQYSKEYHDNPFSNPKNRLVPPVFTVKVTVPDYFNIRNIAYSLQTSTMLEVDISEDNLTIKNVANPLSLINELTSYGLEAEVQGDDLTKYDQGFDDFKLGQKVALLGDYEDMNYFYNPEVPAAQAMLVGKKGDRYLLENDQWGRFEASEGEIGHVR